MSPSLRGLFGLFSLSVPEGYAVAACAACRLRVPKESRRVCGVSGVANDTVCSAGLASRQLIIDANCVPPALLSFTRHRARPLCAVFQP